MTNNVNLRTVYNKIVQQREIYADVNKELIRQDEIWGFQDHSLADWIVILGEEFGEACKEISEMRMAGDIESMVDAKGRLDEEMVQVIAVCFRILEKVRYPHVDR